MAVEPGDVRDAAAAIHARDTRSLAGSVGDDGSLGDRLGGDDAALALAEDRVAAAEAIRSLDGQSRRLLHMYFYEERTQAQIASVLGVSQMQVSRLLQRTLRRVRRRAGAEAA